jgi:DUF3071 family protein
MTAHQAKHYLCWAQPFHETIRGRVGSVPGRVWHLWHGDLAGRAYAERHSPMKGFGFDPGRDIAEDADGSWRWSSAKPQLHAYVRQYFQSQREDGSMLREGDRSPGTDCATLVPGQKLATRRDSRLIQGVGVCILYSSGSNRGGSSSPPSKLETMVRLHLVGFTTDLKNLIFADERGARAGGFVVSVDSRLKNTLEEVARLEEEDSQYEAQSYEAAEEPQPEQEPEAPPPRPRAPKVTSKLTPKEIQSLLRQGKTEEQVARLAQTNVDWIKRFSFAILAERQDVIDAVKAATLSKPRLGPSGLNIGEAVEENIGAKRLRMTPQEMDDAWKAVRKNGRWHVSFEYLSRGQKRLARYSFDPSNRLVEPLNEVALELGWRADPRARGASPNAAPSPRVSGSIVKPTAARSTAGSPRASGVPRTAVRPAAGATKPPASSRSAGGAENAQSRRPRPASGSTRAAPAPRAPLPASQPEERPKPAPRRRVPEPEEVSGSSRRAQTEPAPPRPQAPSGFVEGKPKPDRPSYSSIPKVWRPSRRP